MILLGQEASRTSNAQAVRNLLQHYPYAVMGTFQAAGVLSRELQYLFIGRVGLFKNQPGDILLEKADVVLTIGYNPVEYDPEIWNHKRAAKIIHLDYQLADINLKYQPEVELIGDIDASITALQAALTKRRIDVHEVIAAQDLHANLYQQIEQGKSLEGKLIHPLRFIYELRQAISDDTLVICDVGTVYMWMARYFLCYQPHHLLFSNGQQTLGVALPWAMAASFAYPTKKIISISGDGGFLFSAMELETAVREKCNFVHFIWTDGSYNMVLEQEVMKYQRKSGVELGKIDVVDFARSFGTKSFELKNPGDLPSLLNEAFAHKGPVLINVPIDYSENLALFQNVDPKQGVN